MQQPLNNAAFSQLRVLSEEESKGWTLLPSSHFTEVKTAPIDEYYKPFTATVIPTKLSLQYILAFLTRIYQARKVGCNLKLGFYYSIFDKQKHSIASHLSKLRTSKTTPDKLKALLNFRLIYKFESAITRNGVVFLIYSAEIIKGVTIDDTNLTF